jgi:hypothetical protein
MRRLPECLFLLTVVLLCGFYAVPVGDYYIEGQPDPQHVGGIISLGTIPAHTIRFALLLAFTLPLASGAVFTAVSKRFEKRQRNWGRATLALLFGLLVLSGLGVVYP